MTEQTRPRAFAVWFKDLKRWSVNSFYSVDWQWPAEHVRPLRTALTRKQDVVDRSLNAFHTLQLATIRFDGTVEPRSTEGKADFKGTLFAAKTGDVIYSKIDVRNGAIGIVPPGMPQIAVSSEFPVYHVKPEVADPQYVTLLFRTAAFRKTINSMISGASGRKRVQPEQLEDIRVPLPPLPVQQAIVARWEAAQADIKSTRERLVDIEGVTSRLVLDHLGIPPQEFRPLPRAFAMNWRDLERWSGRATMLLAQQKQLGKSKFPIVLGRDCLGQVKHGCSSGPSSAPTTLDVIRISAVTRGGFNPCERKYMYDVPQYRQEFDLQGGDILMCRTNGTLAYVGKSCLVKSHIPDLIFPDKVIRLRVKENILPEYLNEVLGLVPLRAQIEAAARTAVGNYAIGNQDIGNLQIPLPPLDVQREIVQQVQTQRQEMARLQEQAERKAKEIRAEVEALILGARRIEENTLI